MILIAQVCLRLNSVMLDDIVLIVDRDLWLLGHLVKVFPGKLGLLHILISI